MNGLPDQPWHAEAIRLDALGTPKEEIAERVGRSLLTVQHLLLPKLQASTKARLLRRHHRKMADPAWREKQRLRSKAYRTDNPELLERERIRDRARRARRKEATPCTSTKTTSLDTCTTPTSRPSPTTCSS
jgi:hypothetical protein